MNGLSWKPWYYVLRLREDLKTGDLLLHLFAADLYGVVVQRQRGRIYEDPGEFFCLTSPTDMGFCCAALVPFAAGEPSRPSDAATRCLDQTAGPDCPRVCRNAVVLAVP